jgi:predicted tellurium resistance membrane protein TerC
MGFLRKEWPLLLSAAGFLALMVADFFMGFMAGFTSMTSGRQSDLFVSAGFVTVITLAFLEGVLGIDNATVLAIQVRHLKPADAHKALTWGIWGAFTFRFIFLLAAGFILEQKWIMAIGGFYLINMAADFFLKKLTQLLADMLVLGALFWIFFLSAESIYLAGFRLPVWIFFTGLFVYSVYRYIASRRADAGHAEPEEEGIQVSRFQLARYPLLAAIIAVEWTDILFSFDSIGAGLALTRDFWVLFWGAFFGVTCLRLFAKAFIRLLERYPQLEGAAMLAVLIVGAKMAFEAVQDTLKVRLWHIENWQTSLVILLIFTAAFFVRAKTPHISEEK